MLSGECVFSVKDFVANRFPRVREQTLSQKTIFIVPSKISVGLIAIIILLFLLGINFQNSLVYVVCFWLIALLVINILYTYKNIAGLTIKAVGAEPCFAGEKMVLELEVSRPVNQRKSAIYFGWKNEDLVELNLQEQQSTRIKLSHSTKDRGRFSPPRLDIFTRYPTGLTTAWSYAAVDMDAIVYPEPIENSNQIDKREAGDETDEGVEISGGSNDFAGVRQYQAGDSPRHIHWGQFAKTGDLYTKSFVDYESHEAWLDWEKLNIAGIEPRLSHLSAMVLQFNNEQRQFGLRIPGKVIEPSSGEGHKVRCLTALALYGLPAEGAAHA
ncbi:DUF58 domain-containing protein [Leucothrix pacifica]|uniref:DUF58 domain-containing protein n=1 Tax=Leucothrix pacifica TaxID=1247513 RepID=A0A317CDH3_9GAMM|nr:DUF58 domain-containing protein [Leucothrix pacifica]